MNPHAIFEIDGLPWDSWKHPELISRLNVELTTGECSQATFEVFDRDFKFLNRYSTSVGVLLSTCRAWLGYGDEAGSQEPAFKGLLARVQRGESKTTLIAYDMGYKMRRVQKTDYHKGTDLQIIEKLVTRNEPLKFRGPDKPLFKLEPRTSKQDGQTDWEHASEIAHDAGLLLWVRDDTVFADYPAKVGTPTRTLTYRKDFTLLRDFDLQFKLPENVAGRPKGIEVRSRGRAGKRLSGKSDESDRGHEDLHIKRDLSQHTKQRATARAQAQKELDREHAFTLSIRRIKAATGRDDVRDTIRVLELGKLFSGDYLADRVSHEFSPGRLTTSYELYRDVKE
ncbi:MAG TPA: hypothetical protein VIW64_16160 [Pyrinomonadaceae bacterium]|jgi:hypothetical protein